MKFAFITIALMGLITTAMGPILTYAGLIDVETNKFIMLIGMIVWFVGGIPWLGAKDLQPADKQVEI